MKTRSYNLIWSHLMALRELYNNGVTKRRVISNECFSDLEHHRYIKKAMKPNTWKVINSEFKYIYESHFHDKISSYETFLTTHEILKVQSRYKEIDISGLMLISDNKKSIKENLTTCRKLSSTIFKGSKYLESRPGLKNAVLKILNIEEFPEEDPRNHQYLLVVNCKVPKLIILCENLDLLRVPWKARKLGIELWYAGGWNIKKLLHIPKRDQPIYYLCDWDFDGLSIYDRLREIIPKISILEPIGYRKAVEKSIWHKDRDFSGLNRNNYSKKLQELVESLIEKKEWIEEESNNLDEVINVNKILID